ncbi:MAG: phosphate signaling complex protein PhoU [Anaerovoracaceae bacterium]|jgi:phosphate transport system protein
MMMKARPTMDKALKEINRKVEEMSEHIQEDIRRAVSSVKEKNSALARDIIDHGDVIDDMEDEINADCFRFLATQAPVASDLRYCVSVMKMIRDLERMGDHCEDLAKYTMRLEDIDYECELVDLPRMAEMAAQMVNNAIDAFLGRNLRLARKVWKADEEVDELYRDIFEQEMEEARRPGRAEIAISFAFIAAHLERIADYATNICEETVFFLEGEFEIEQQELQPKN